MASSMFPSTYGLSTSINVNELFVEIMEELVQSIFVFQSVQGTQIFAGQYNCGKPLSGTVINN